MTDYLSEEEREELAADELKGSSYGARTNLMTCASSARQNTAAVSSGA